jgi:hypothetical protein
VRCDVRTKREGKGSPLIPLRLLAIILRGPPFLAPPPPREVSPWAVC